MKYEYMKDIVRYLKKELPDNKTKEWVEYCKSLEDLLNALAPYNMPDENNKYKSIDEEDYKKIDELFQKATTASNNYLKQPYEEANINEEFRYNVAKNLNDEFLNKAYIEYQNIKPNKDVSLREAMENFRNVDIELSDNEIKTVGGELSQRQQLTVKIDGKPVKGIFTPTTNFDTLKDYEHLVDEIIDYYPEYADLFKDLKNEKGFDAISNADITDFFGSGEIKAEKPLNYIVDGLSAKLQPKFAEYAQEERFQHAIIELVEKNTHIAGLIMMNKKFLGMNHGDNIDKRNSAMSGIAHLLGKDDMLAKSRPMTIKQNINGKTEIVTGTFMEFAKGKDFYNLPINDEARDFTNKNFETPAGKRALANLQILDFICGNVDRHPGNMFYDFDPVTHELRGVQGIDNDASFTTKKLGPNDYNQKMMGINKMKVIDAEMALVVSKLEEGPFKATLQGYGLKANEIDAAWDRTKELQEAISKNNVYNPEEKFKYERPKEGSKIIIVPHDAWDKISLQDLNRGGKNIFDMVDGITEMANSRKEPNKDFEPQIEMHEIILNSKMEHVAELVDDAKDAKNLFGSSKRYNNILSTLKAYDNAKEKEEKFEKLKELKEYIKTYYAEKKELGHLDKDNKAIGLKGKDLARVELVNKLEKYIDNVYKEKDTLDDLKVKQQDDLKAVEEFNKAMDLREAKKEEKEPEPEKVEEKKAVEQISISLDDDVEIKAEEKQVEDNYIKKDRIVGKN